MDREELIQFLKDNLTVEIKSAHRAYSECWRTTITLKIDGQEISHDYFEHT